MPANSRWDLIRRWRVNCDLRPINTTTPHRLKTSAIKHPTLLLQVLDVRILHASAKT